MRASRPRSRRQAWARRKLATVQVTGRNGKIAFVGFGETRPTMTPAQLIEKQLTLFGSFVFPIDRYEEMLRFVLKHEVPIEATVTHDAPSTRRLEVFPAFDRGETGKVVFTWDETNGN